MIKKSILIAVAAFTVFVGFAGGCSTPSAVPMRPVFEFSHNQNQKQTEKSDYPDLNQMNVSSYFPNNKSTFVLKDLDSKQTYILNDNLANTRYAPQSTFKILNALIGLQTGAVADEYTVKRWDGKKRSRDVWNQDHTLASGMRYSVVWYFQAMARDIGESRMQEWLNRVDYGNKDSSGGIDRFWLNSTLEISPVEQVEFITKLVQETLPFDQKWMKTVKRIMIQEEENEYTIYGKTGGSTNPAYTWYAGFMTIADRTYVFATYVPAEEGKPAPNAAEITKRILNDCIISRKGDEL